MENRWAQHATFALLAIVNTVAMASCAYLIQADGKEQCIQRWAQSSTPSKVTKAGCMVEKSPSNWVPEEFMKDGR